MRLRVIVWPEMGEEFWWIAQGIEFDLAVQAKTPAQAQIDFIDMLRARWEIAKKLSVNGPLDGILPAPKRFEATWDSNRLSDVTCKSVEIKGIQVIFGGYAC